LYDLSHAPVETSWQGVPNDDTKGNLELQTWSSQAWQAWGGWSSEFPILGLIGPSGLVLKGLSGSDFTIDTRDFTISDRYANLLPIETDPTEFLAADLASGVLVLHSRNDVLLFQLGYAYWNGQIQDYTGTACRDGLLCVNHDFTPASMHLFFLPFDPRQPPARFSLQWPADSLWLPWAIAATPDASTVVVIAQETDSNNNITAHYGRLRALIYHPGGFPTAPSAWPIQTAFELNAPATDAFTPRYAALTPDARTLLYWNVTTTVARYNTGAGRPLGSLELGPVSARSRDGHRVAAVSPAGRLRVYDLASGDTLLDLPGQPESAASGVCFSTDGSRLVAAQGGLLNAYDITSGQMVSSVRSSLLPLAWPSRGNRFLAFQPDTSGAGGSIVLADTADARVAAVLNRAGNTFTPAFFSDSGNQLALVRDRRDAEVLRSLRPDELPAVLNTGLPESTEIQPLPPIRLVTTTPVPLAVAGDPASAVLRADDIPTLLSHLGDKITIQGRVQRVSVLSDGAANVYFAGPETPPVQVWVPWKTYPKLVAVLGPNLVAVLNDRTLRATGRLTNYKGMLEVTLADPAQLHILPPDGQPNQVSQARP